MFSIIDFVGSRVMVLLLFLAPFSASFAQNADSLINKLDSLKKQTDTTGQVNLVEPEFYNERTKMNLKVFSILLIDDFKQQALSPTEIRNKGWLTGAMLVGSAYALSFADKPVQKWAVQLRNRNPGIAPWSKTLSDIGGAYEVVPLAAIATYGFVFKNPKLRTTTALATQAYITTTFWSTLFKSLSGKLRPNSFNPDDPLNSPRFHGPFTNLPYGGNSAFPSGHAALAFAAARVYAMEYKNVPAVPVISYSLATLVTLSRITENRHWVSDLFAGALLGYACGTQVVNNYHRYARLVRTGQTRKKKKKGDMTFNIQYVPGVGVQPGFVYKWR